MWTNITLPTTTLTRMSISCKKSKQTLPAAPSNCRKALGVEISGLSRVWGCCWRPCWQIRGWAGVPSSSAVGFCSAGASVGTTNAWGCSRSAVCGCQKCDLEETRQTRALIGRGQLFKLPWSLFHQMWLFWSCWKRAHFSLLGSSARSPMLPSWGMFGGIEFGRESQVFSKSPNSLCTAVKLKMIVIYLFYCKKKLLRW